MKECFGTGRLTGGVRLASGSGTVAEEYSERPRDEVEALRVCDLEV